MRIFGTIFKVKGSVGYREERVPTFEEYARDSIQLADGLYPPHIIAMYYCENFQDYPRTGKKYQGFWAVQYGVENLDKLLHRLESNGYIYLGECEKKSRVGTACYRLTEKGKTMLRRYEYIAYVHKMDFYMTGPWSVESDINKDPRYHTYPWRDKLWQYYNNLSLEYNWVEHPTEYRWVRYDMAKFSYEEKRYEQVVRFLDEAINIDTEQWGKAAPALVELREKAKKQLAKQKK